MQPIFWYSVLTIKVQSSMASSSLFHEQQTSQWHIHIASLLNPFNHGRVNIFIFCRLKNFYSSLVLVIVVPVKLQLFVLLFQVICGVNSHTLFFSKMSHRHTWSNFALTLFSVLLLMTDGCFLCFLFLPTGVSSIFWAFFTGQLNSNWQNNNHLNEKGKQY